MRLWSVFALPILLGSSLAQSTQNGSSEGYLLRLERITEDGDVCLLLRTTGSYQLEEVHGDDTAVYDASLAEATLSEVRQQLNDDALRGLTQDRVPAPILTSRREFVALSIARGAGWQNLQFRSPESWAQIKEPLEQLLALLKGLRKVSGPRFGDERANHCQPPGNPALKIRRPLGQSSEEGGGNAGGPIPGPSPTPSGDGGPPEFLVLVKVFRISGTLAERNCVVLFSGGRYHLERSTQRYSEHMKSQVVEDNLTDPELKQLQNLLQAPELLNARSTEPPQTTVFGEGGMTMVSIPRANGIQTLLTGTFIDFQRRASGGKQVVGDDRSLKPLLSWIESLKNHTKAPRPDAVASDCSLPQP